MSDTFKISETQEVYRGDHILIDFQAGIEPGSGVIGWIKNPIPNVDLGAIRQNIDARYGMDVEKIRRHINLGGVTNSIEAVVKVTEKTTVQRSIPEFIYAGEQFWYRKDVEKFAPDADPLAARGTEKVGEVVGNIGSGVATFAGWAKWTVPLILIVVLIVYASPYIPKGRG